MTSRVLLVEDDDRLRRTLAITLRARGYDVAVAADGRTALELARREPPHVVVLDLGLPDIDGVQVVRELRAWSAVPVVVLSARDSQPAKVAALDTGVDDYVTKPFGTDELLARVRAALRRSPVSPGSPVVAAAGFTVDLAAHRVQRDGADVRLTPTEWHLLEILIRHPGELVPGRRLLREVWGPAYENETHYLRVYLAQLRRKLEVDPAHPRHLVTEPGVGYRFEP